MEYLKALRDDLQKAVDAIAKERAIMEERDVIDGQRLTADERNRAEYELGRKRDKISAEVRAAMEALDQRLNPYAEGLDVLAELKALNL